VIKYQTMFERSTDAILILDGETFVDCNEATVKMLRYRNKSELLQTHPSDLSPPVQPDGRSSFEKASEMIATAIEKGSHRFEWMHRRADGEDFPVEVLLTFDPRGRQNGPAGRVEGDHRAEEAGKGTPPRPENGGGGEARRRDRS